jgi:hypothetical protein
MAEVVAVSEEPKPVPQEVVDAIGRGDYVVCYAKCWPCQFAQHSDEPHTWMDDEDREHAGIPKPTTPDEWAALAADKPCGCHCNEAHR